MHIVYGQQQRITDFVTSHLDFVKKTNCSGTSTDGSTQYLCPLVPFSNHSSSHCVWLIFCLELQNHICFFSTLVQHYWCNRWRNFHHSKNFPFFSSRSLSQEWEKSWIDVCLQWLPFFYSFLESEGRRWRRFKRCKWNSESANIINEQHEKRNGRTHRAERWHKTWSCDAYRCENWILRLSLRRKLFSLNIEYFLKESESEKKMCVFG